MKRDDAVYNVTSALDVYPIEREGDTLSYDRMTLKRVDRLTRSVNRHGKRPRQIKAGNKLFGGLKPFSPAAFLCIL